MQPRNTLWAGVTDAQWAKIEHEIPAAAELGRQRGSCRGIVNGLLYKANTGCSWEQVPQEFCSRSTGSRYYREWLESGTWHRIWAAFFGALSAKEKQEWAVAVLESGWIPVQNLR